MNKFWKNLLIISFAVLSGRLFWLQIIKGAYYRDLADNNRLRISTIFAPRGIITDRNGYVLARNLPLYKICSDINKCQIIKREDALRKMAAGEKILEVVGREYPAGESAAHLIGYVNEATIDEVRGQRSEVKNSETQKYALGSLIGRMGIEQYYDEILRGIDGREMMETDTRGRDKRLIGRQEPIPGQDLQLSIDLELQKKAIESFKKSRPYPSTNTGQGGAIIVSKPTTGEILVLYSEPSFDPNLFARGDEEVSRILNDTKNQPLINRAISGQYPPGSTFKLVVASAGLESTKINQNTQFEDTGVIRLGQWTFPNWLWLKRGQTDGLLNITTAIKRSNDVFFYRLAEKVGPEEIKKWARKFGLGQKTGVDLPEESTGLIPDEAWKKQVIGEDWYLGDTYHLGIGQGYLLTTPFQVHLWTDIVANNGKKVEFRIKNLESRINEKQQIISQQTVDIIKEGMRQACQDGGTGWPLFDFKKAVIACKTGTAEFGDAKNRTHAWFTAFSEINNEPDIAVTVLVEAGGEGSDVAAPIAREIFEAYYQQ